MKNKMGRDAEHKVFMDLRNAEQLWRSTDEVSALTGYARTYAKKMLVRLNDQLLIERRHTTRDEWRLP